MTTEDRIAKIEAQIDELKAEQAALREHMDKVRIDHWKGRIEDLEIQMHLGAMDASARLTALMDQLHEKWADARQQFEEHLSAASSAGDTVRAGLEKAFDDLRKALLESKNKLA